MSSQTGPRIFRMDEELVEDYIGKKYWYYIKSFTDMKRKQSKLSWNFAAFLFGVMWLAYRKMYRHAVAFAFLKVVIVGVLVYRQLHEHSTDWFLLAIVGVIFAAHLIIGALGNQFYMVHVYRNVKILAYTPVSREAQVSGAEKTGQTSFISSVIALLALAVFSMALLIVVDAIEDRIEEAQPVGVEPRSYYSTVDIVSRSTIEGDGRTVGEVFDEQFMFGQWNTNDLEGVTEEVVYTGTLLQRDEIYEVTLVFEVNPHAYQAVMSEVLVDGYLLTGDEAWNLLNNLFK
ncbi:DUF2628 domain-containing protein [Alkalibacillus haloalkaliphilus]|uniref:DUF2628 domain-containing protein n=1 Tax=Alkalibacillus haloalkaliphilus TaxID=94136 RepID=UPI0029362832|nr:DUF2628 domain-containing protein [Alkalibacillus haloalkaliphilus]MDV2583027.1 DUF2628 domain-containing protein [Alkalibacillus haloalkaliphilus]